MGSFFCKVPDGHYFGCGDPVLSLLSVPCCPRKPCSLGRPGAAVGEPGVLFLPGLMRALSCLATSLARAGHLLSVGRLGCQRALERASCLALSVTLGSGPLTNAPTAGIACTLPRAVARRTECVLVPLLERPLDTCACFALGLYLFPWSLLCILCCANTLYDCVWIL